MNNSFTAVVSTVEAAVDPRLAHNQQQSYLLYLADSNLVLAQRTAGWCGHGPILEQDIAITNITLDLLGQARNFYQLAATLMNETEHRLLFANNVLQKKVVTEDGLAYLRTEREYSNLLICELPRGDWAFTVLRLFFTSSFSHLLYSELLQVADHKLAAIAEKSLREVNYHVRWSSEWVIRLGDGTAESRQRLLTALDELWGYTGEFFVAEPFENFVSAQVDLLHLKKIWLNTVSHIFEEATIAEAAKEKLENSAAYMYTGGKRGIHTEYLGPVLAEMQYLQRCYPGAEW